MARLKKVPQSDEHSEAPQLEDELRRFIAYASDMIEEQRSVRLEIQKARHALERVKTEYEKSSKAIIRRQSEAVKVDIRSNIEEAHTSLVESLTAPLIQVESTARELRGLAFWAGLSGGVLGSSMVILVQIIAGSIQ